MSRRSSTKSKRVDSQVDNKEEYLDNNGTKNEDTGEIEDLDEEQEVTRCVCGQDELTNQMIDPQLQQLLKEEYGIKIDQGLYIQCDKCSVWQHGYCVGLFTDEEAPDKYWCELCKPELHIHIEEVNELPRTLYKPVNERRPKLLENQEMLEEAKGSGRSRRVQRTASGSQDTKITRKERRQLDEDYDKQLERALRESAKESGIVYEEKNGRGLKRRSRESLDSVKGRSDCDSNGNNVTKNGDTVESDRDELKNKRQKSKPRSSKPRSLKSNSGDKSQSEQFTKDELLSQPSKPRFVNEKSSIYELRKRTGAILEWLGRSQIELEEENLGKSKLFSYKDKLDLDSNKMIENYNENLHLMEQLTEKILEWEEKFGKYAP